MSCLRSSGAGVAESATPGVGLGLAICQAVVQAHRGQLTAGNAAGGGAEFTVSLPRRLPPAMPDTPENA
jgi:two-component system sensor histidine kinase KdpD